jgi:hypothetical protein
MGADASAPRAGGGGVAAALEALEREQLAAALAASAAAHTEARPAPHRAASAAPPFGTGFMGLSGDAAAARPPAPRVVTPFAPSSGAATSSRGALPVSVGAGGAGARDEDDEALALALALSASEAQTSGSGFGGESARAPFRATCDTQAPPDAQLAEDAALAAALAEAELDDARNPPAPPPFATNRGAHVDDSTAADAALAAALQAEEQAAAAAQPPPVPPSSSRATRRAAGCGGCGEPLGLLSFTGGATLTALGRSWHAACFRCALCGERISERFAVINGGAAGTPQPAHAACQREAFHPRCAVCHDFIPARGGSIPFKLTPVWDERWCPEHDGDGTRRCCGCERLEPRPKRHASDEAHATLPDGRALCVGCVPSAVVDEADAAPLYADVRAFFADQGVPLPATPPLRLVDAGVLAALAQRDDAPHEADLPASSGRSTLRGLTLTEEVVVRPVARSDPFGATLGAALTWGLGGPEALPRRVGCRVSCIAVLSALPRLLAGSVLAHECCHALLRLGAPLSLTPRVEEGVCQLMGLLWLERQAATLQDPRAVAHAAQLAHAIRNDASEVYGAGARDAIRAYRAVGLTRLLDAVRATGRLPPVPDGAGLDVADEMQL